MVAAAVEKMIAFYDGDLHDINHFLKVWAFAKTIGGRGGLDAHTLETLELTAVVHDIACPLCRKKYGDTDGKHQERESAPLVAAFFAEPLFAGVDVARISHIVSHHHTYTGVNGIDYQILLEADFLVNADESGLSSAAIAVAKERIFRTAAGVRLLCSMYLEGKDREK